MSDAASEITEKFEGAAVQSPFCGSLRSKKYFKLDVIPTNADDYIDAANHCWCRETQQVIGVDGGLVEPGRCVAGRTCYRSALS